MKTFSIFTISQNSYFSAVFMFPNNTKVQALAPLPFLLGLVSFISKLDVQIKSLKFCSTSLVFTLIFYTYKLVLTTI